MFSTVFKNKYKINAAYAAEDQGIESPEITETQAAFLKKVIDQTPVPGDVEQVVLSHPMELDTLRDAAR